MLLSSTTLWMPPKRTRALPKPASSSPNNKNNNKNANFLGNNAATSSNNNNNNFIVGSNNNNNNGTARRPAKKSRVVQAPAGVAAARTTRTRGRAAQTPGNTGAGPSTNATARQVPGVKAAPPKIAPQVMKIMRDMIRKRGGSWKKMIDSLSDEEARPIIDLCKKNSNRCPLNAKDRIKLIHEMFGRKSNKVQIQQAIFDVTVAFKQGGAAGISHQAPLDPNLTKEDLTQNLREAAATMRTADPKSKTYREKVAKHMSWFPSEWGDFLLRTRYGTIGTVGGVVGGVVGGASAGVSATTAVSQWFFNLFNDLMKIDSRSRTNTLMKTAMALAPGGLGLLKVESPLIVIATIIGLGCFNEHMHDTQEAKENHKEKNEGIARFIGALIARYTYSIVVALTIHKVGLVKWLKTSLNTTKSGVDAAAEGARAVGASFGLVGAGAGGIADIAIALTKLIRWGVASAPGAAVAVGEGIRSRAGYARRSFTSFRTSYLGIHNKRKFFTASFWGRDGVMTISKLAAGTLRLFMFRFRYFMQNPDIYTATALAISVLVLYKIMSILLRTTTRLGVRAARGVYMAVRSRKRARNSVNVTNVRGAVNATNVPIAPFQRAHNS